MGWVLRTQNGVVVAELDEETAVDVMENVDMSYFTMSVPGTDGKLHAFRINENKTMTFNRRLKLLLWEGFKLVKE